MVHRMRIDRGKVSFRVQGHQAGSLTSEQCEHQHSHTVPLGTILITGGTHPPQKSSLLPEDALVYKTKLKLYPYPLSPSLNICSINEIIVRGFATAAIRLGKPEVLLGKAIHHRESVQLSLAGGCVCSCQGDDGNRPSEAYGKSVHAPDSLGRKRCRGFVITGPGLELSEFELREGGESQHSVEESYHY